MLVIGEQLVCEREEGNPSSCCLKNGNIVGHVQHNISTLCSLVIRQGGTILCVVVDSANIQGKFSMIKHSWLAKIRKSFPPRMI